MKNITFKKKRLAAMISVLVGSSMMAPLSAAEVEAADKKEQSLNEASLLETQEGEYIEVISVSGIRGSLGRSMNFKREGQGVVDAISAEEMGKFPDTNLAESLQRIPGVTISRKNGEGSQITVRGFGPEYNLVTLNGRQMPGTGNTRSYDLENLSSEGVSSLTVIKTARAENPSGGIGATVNIETTRPLNSPGLKYSVSGKGIYDTSNKKGDDVTPEVAGIFSNTFADETFGVALSLSHQERSQQQQSAVVDGWRALTNADLGAATGANAIDRRPVDAEGNKIGPAYIPRNLGYSITDAERIRTNGQLTLQYAPTNDFIATVDYTASRAETANESLAFGVWFNAGGNINSYELDERGTAIKFNEANNDYAHTGRKSTTLVEAESIGLNLDWQLTDALHLELDYHDSTNEIDNGADKGSHSNPFVIVGPNNLLSKTYDYSSGDIPQVELFWPDGAAEADRGDFDPLFARFDTDAGESKIEQIQLHGIWENQADGALVNIKFGIAHTDQNMSGYGAGVGTQGPNGYNGNMAVFPDSIFTRNDTGDFLDQFAGGGSDLTTDYYYSYDFDEVVSRMKDYFDGFETNPYASGGKDSLTSVNEVTDSAYLQASFDYELADMPITVTLGLRYEQTDVTSNNKQRVESQVVWKNATEWDLRYVEGGAGFVDSSGDYDIFLPNLDISIDITDDLVGRFSIGKTMSRAPLGFLIGSRTLTNSPKPGARNGSQGNTDLLPFESTNIDVSFEYYYSDDSYVSLGYFNKKVKNFISTAAGTEIINVGDLRDPLIGPRAIQAEADLIAQGIQPTVGAIFDQIIANGGGTADACCETQVVAQSSDDPLVDWTISKPVNGDTKEVYGVEFAVQHMFGESGFGTAFNATLVDGDVEFDRDSLEIQSPLNGLSNSANLTAFYEDDELSVKFTYAWRDEYLLGVGQAQGSADTPPQFFKEFAQLDMSVNYDLNENMTVFLEGYNLTNETEEIYGRYEEQFLSARQYGPRYALGARYSF